MSEGTWLLGRPLCRWLEEDEGCVLNEVTLASHIKDVRSWKTGAKVHVFDADKVLTKLGLHLHLVPDDVWAERGPRTTKADPLRKVKRFSKREKAKAVRRVLSGETQEAVARDLGCHRRSVAKWLEAAA